MTIYMTDGSLIQRETAPGSGSYATLPQASKIKLPTWVRKTTDVYIHDQTAPVTKTGASEPMESTFELAWDPGHASHQLLFTDWTEKTERSYQVVLTDSGAAQFRFNAIVSNIEPQELDAEGAPLLISVTLKLAAEPVITW
jgi:hypothetical protein